MAKFCLTKQFVDKFIDGLKSGAISPAKLSGFESDARRDYLAEFVGKENAKEVNTLFESKLLLKRQEQGLISWAEKVSGLKSDSKKQLIEKIKTRKDQQTERLLNPKEQEVFLKDLAESRLGVGVSKEEAKNIFELSKKLEELKTKVGSDFSDKTKKDRIELGATRETLTQYVASLKGRVDQGTGLVNPLARAGLFGKAGAVGKDVGVVVKFVAQNSRAFVASFDNSFWGNQGIRAALDYKYTKIWTKNFAKSFLDAAKVLTVRPEFSELLFKGNKRTDEVLSAVRSEIYSRKNSINGRYEMSTKDTSKLDLMVAEEEIPTSIPSRIPVLGRVFKAAEVIYEAGALRLRADIADKAYEMAEKRGVNLDDPFEVGSINVVVNSITGRGRVKNIPDIVNDAVFSVKYTKSQIDFLTLNAFDKISPNARKQATSNIFNVLAATAILLGLSKALDDDSTDFDSRSTKFGKIEKDGITLINLMPGYGGMITLISRILSQSTKNRKGAITKLGEGYGVPDGMDVFWDFTENKASPIAAIIRDLVRQKTFEGDKPSVENTLSNSLTSISLESSKKILEDKSGDSLLKVLAIGLGILGTGAGTTTYPVNWNNTTSKARDAFKEKVGQEKFDKANQDFNSQYDVWFNKVSKTPQYKNLSDDSKKTLTTNAKEKIQDKVFKQYGYTVKKPKQTNDSKKEKSILNKLEP